MILYTLSYINLSMEGTLLLSMHISTSILPHSQSPLAASPTTITTSNSPPHLATSILSLPHFFCY